MSLATRLNQVDERTKLTVYGWLRKAQNELKIDSIAPLISVWCVLYADNHEIFEFIGKAVIISDDQKCISSGSESDGFVKLKNHNYGTIQIPSMSNTVCQWDIRIKKKRKRVSMFVGISSIITPNPTQAMWEDGGYYYLIHDSCYKYNDSMRWIKYNDDEKIEQGDTVSVHLDLNQKQVRYFVNDEDLGVAYYNIVTREDVTYRLMVSLSAFVEVEILNFRYISRCNEFSHQCCCRCVLL